MTKRYNWDGLPRGVVSGAKNEVCAYTWDLPVVRPGQALTLTATPEAEECLRRWAWNTRPPPADELVDAVSGSAYSRRDAERTAAMHWPQVTVTQIHDSVTIEGKHMPKPRVTDAQVRLNQDTEWLAADVVFVSAAQLNAGPPYVGQSYTYKAPPGAGHKQGLLAHVIVNGALRSVCIAEVRKPTAEDKLTAHAWLIVDGCYQTYAEAVKDDEERLAAIVKAQNDAKLEEDLREALKRTSPTKSPGKLQLRVGGKYRSRKGEVVEITHIYANNDGARPLVMGRSSRTSNNNCYSPAGRRYLHGEDSDENLVEEVK